MFEQYRIQVQYRLRQRQVMNALLALATAILTLIYPNFLYLIAGSYLVALGILFIAFKIPATLSSFPIVAGILIFIFPELIPITFAVFLGCFGLLLLISFQFTLMGFLTLLIGILIVFNPDSVAYLIASFLLLYSISNLIRYYRDWQNHDGSRDDGPVSVQ